MNANWDSKRCTAVLKGQIELLKKISAAEDTVRKAVMKREWTDFDEKTREVNRLGEEFSSLEEERAKLFSALTSKGEDVWVIEERPFYSSIMTLPVEERRELSCLYRELKMETMKMRALNETFLAYLNEARTLTSAYLEAVCPARGGKLYTRKGSKASQDLRSIVFNNRF
jgi:hypothetical protein